MVHNEIRPALDHLAAVNHRHTESMVTGVPMCLQLAFGDRRRSASREGPEHKVAGRPVQAP